MSQSELGLMAHLLRRAGFGATRDELEGYVAMGYKEAVEELLHPEKASPALENEDVFRRYHVDANNLAQLDGCQMYWLYRMIHTSRPLEEKIALFWHGVFATGYTKLNQPRAIYRQIDMFRCYGLGSFRTLLVRVSQDPAMIFWLDNKENHGNAVNENYGRELLELFSMGVGNYTEDDVRQCSRAFTGWTIRNAPYHSARASRDSIWPYGRLDWQFQYRDDDHDEADKTFLGQTDAFNGEDVIDIIVRKPATARFISRHLYNFFVADEPQVPAWQTVPPRDPAAVSTLMEAFVEHDYDIRSVLRILFNSAFFKEASFAKVKSPADVVAGAAHMAGSFGFADVEDIELGFAAANMGQQLLDPPSVEGWHTGMEWITTDSLVGRVNFASDQFRSPGNPGVRSIIDRIKAQGPSVSPYELVDACLDLIGPLTVSESTRQELLDHASAAGELRFESPEEERTSTERILQTLQLIVATREYQMA